MHRSAALCLAQALKKCVVPKSVTVSSGWDHVGVTDGSGSPNLKEILIAWLLMTDQSDELENNCRPHPIICRWAFSLSLCVESVDVSVICGISLFK